MKLPRPKRVILQPMDDQREVQPGPDKGEGVPQTTDRPLDAEKVLRLASLTRSVLEEAKSMDPEKTPSDELVALYKRVSSELAQSLPTALSNELENLKLDAAFHDGATTLEVRLAYSGLIGWFQGLFQGLSAAMQVQSLTRELDQLERGTKKEEETKGRYL